jgi:hypothetical protein
VSPQVAITLPVVLGALSVLGAVVIAIVKGYRWFLGEIKSVISGAMAAHEKAEGEWQKAIKERLDRIEAKVDRLTERNSE